MKKSNEDRKKINMAWLNGKSVQVAYASDPENFTDFTSDEPMFYSPAYIWRIKPTPTLRPWKPEEVPVGALYRGKGWAKTERGLIIYSCSNRFEVGGITVIGGFPFEYALEHGEHSTDNGATWKPCGVFE